MHKESSDIADALLREAILRGDNVVLSNVARNYERIARIIQGLQRAGYRVSAH